LRLIDSNVDGDAEEGMATKNMTEESARSDVKCSPDEIPHGNESGRSMKAHYIQKRIVTNVTGIEHYTRIVKVTEIAKYN
jgi:hypothetical protein